jgi:hypothetical protein
MNDIMTLIDKYGADIVKQLNIASSELYSKILWYIRIGGVLDLLAGIVVLSLTLIGTILAWKITAKDDFLVDEIVMRCLIACLGGLMFVLLGILILQVIGMPIVKIVAPEYWIINSIINK